MTSTWRVVGKMKNKNVDGYIFVRIYFVYAVAEFFS